MNKQTNGSKLIQRLTELAGPDVAGLIADEFGGTLIYVPVYAHIDSMTTPFPLLMPELMDSI